MWICPKCSRKFKNTNQAHGCHQISVADHLAKRSILINQLFGVLDPFIRSLGTMRVEAVPPDVIFYKTKSTFIALKLKTKWIDVEFFLNHHDDSPVVKKFLQTSKHRFVHIVSVDAKEDINDQLKRWIDDSYQLILQ